MAMPLHEDNVQEWFRELARRLRVFYRLQLANYHNQSVIVFTGKEATIYSLRLVQVEWRTRFAIVLFKGLNETQECLYAWNLVDAHNSREFRLYCTACMKTHEADEHPINRSGEAVHTWNNDAPDMEAFVESFLGSIVGFVRDRLDDKLLPA